MPVSRVHVQSGRRPVTLHRTRQSGCSDCSRHVSPGQGARFCRPSVGAGGKAGGEWDSQQTQVVPPARLTPRHTALWAVFEHRWAQKDGLSTFPQEIWNGYILFLFYSKLSGKSDFSLCDKLTWCKWSILSFKLLSTVKNFPDVWVEVKLESLLPVRILYFNLKIILFA